MFALGSGVAGGSNSTGMLIAGRALQGIGLGGVNMLIDIILCDLVPLRKRGAIFGLPVSGVALLLLVLFLQVGYKKESTIAEKLKHLDYVGNSNLLLSMVPMLLVLSYGGTLRPWSSWRTILPPVLGLLGYVGFHVWEATGWQEEPVMPPRLFRNRTSFIAFSVLFSSPSRSGVQYLPTVITILAFAILSGRAWKRSFAA
ncbi:hypothetical protein K458DRAFT_440801 [Lentithecium fluviatile CBS 122367]|uniref:Major facilitator superfamily (MFS) profile domain-containing protein n=1 Tax=Lentithecium fluviatile CBS 122367 TaxID=1168545 RepID=A0A6G1JCY5_9PLEO|nr:hypothetical protein K458DRAFT_440801 [Lentithecium fluviatile CBS 122367]